MIFKSENITVYGVSTNQLPRKLKRLGAFRYIGNGNDFRLFELCEVYYPHPEAPNECNIQLMEWIEVEYQHGTQNLIRNAIDAVNDIKSITELIGISEETKVI